VRPWTALCATTSTRISSLIEVFTQLIRAYQPGGPSQDKSYTARSTFRMAEDVKHVTHLICVQRESLNFDYWSGMGIVDFRATIDAALIICDNGTRRMARVPCRYSVPQPSSAQGLLARLPWTP